MKKKLLKAILAILFVFSLCVKATDMTFTSSGTITDGNTYDNVYVQNDGTIVNMSGGQVGSGSWGVLGTIDNSIFNMSGGQISTMYINIGPSSTINISGGMIDVSLSFAVMDDGSANISGGNITAGILKTYPDSVVNITGGINLYSLDIRGELNIYRGLLNANDAYISYSSYPATINIFGHGFDYNYNPLSGQGTLTGYLLDNNFFTIEGINQLEYTRFNLIPEPVSLFFFGFGLLAIRKHKKEV